MRNILSKCSSEISLKGANVFIFGRRQNEIDRGVSEIGKNVIGIQGDVSNLADLDRLFDVVKDQKGHLDILFANAGIAQFAPLREISPLPRLYLMA